MRDYSFGSSIRLRNHIGGQIILIVILTNCVADIQASEEGYYQMTVKIVEGALKNPHLC